MDHALIGQAKDLPVFTPTPFLTLAPIVLPSPGRPVDLHLKVSAPTTGTRLPIILLSHGHGRSNGPLATFWASHGFVVIQPTHLSSKSLSLDPKTYPEAPLFWRSRVEDMKLIIDKLDFIENEFPGLRGRIDKSRIAVAGHSLGAHTAGMLLGAQLKDPIDGKVVSMVEPRIKTGILLAPAGSGESLHAAAKSNPAYSALWGPIFTEMRTPALMVVGDNDISAHFTERGADWHADPYFLSEGKKSLLSLSGGEHGLGGIAGWDAGETTDESVEMVEVVRRMTVAYLRSELYPEDKAWEEACQALGSLGAIGKVESK
ncbi:uncharacterized protein PAC_08012 [Phialocephala subalpina]|uniref:Chlorophyllase n=1 Tax=Phialocephala subalpina TaxID=576137 RepID=A0A1L7WZE0_9HELO|nr:uncharacterized protein PAC_08012 [Phialocephala subalpina]